MNIVFNPDKIILKMRPYDNQVKPKKFLGQHFLKDEDIAEKIVCSIKKNLNQETGFVQNNSQSIALPNL